jgi:hypothetical protein
MPAHGARASPPNPRHRRHRSTRWGNRRHPSPSPRTPWRDQLGGALGGPGRSEMAAAPTPRACEPRSGDRDESSQATARREVAGSSRTSPCSGRSIHACLSFVQTDCSGREKFGSANAPTATPTRSGIRAGSQYTFDPHRPQKWNLTGKPVADSRSKTRDVPRSTRTLVRS